MPVYFLFGIWVFFFSLPPISTKLLSNCACADEKQTNALGGVPLEIWLIKFISSALIRPNQSHQIWGWCRAGPTPVPGWGAPHTAWLTLRVGVRVWRRGRRGYGPIAGLLRAVLVSARDGVVGGRSVLKERFVVHHLRGSNQSRSPRST